MARTHPRSGRPARRRVLTSPSVLTALLATGLACAGATQPARAADRLGERTLARGARGADVRELQRTLRRLHADLPVDGRFGRGTATAVRRYERHVHVPVDGAVTPGEARGMRARAGTLAFGRRTLVRGTHGKDVRRLQTLLSALGTPTTADGRFGAGTERHLRIQERSTGLTVDGRLVPAEAMALAAAATRPAAATAGASGGAMRFPVAGSHRSGGPGTGFGDREGRHQGVDIFAACGTPLVAPVDATVARVARGPKAGNYLVLHATTTGEDHVLMHLRERATVSRGTRLHPGDPVGAVGRTGNADGCHLHYEIWTAPGWYAGGAPRDPSPDLAGATP